MLYEALGVVLVVAAAVVGAFALTIAAQLIVLSWEIFRDSVADARKIK